MKMGFFSDLLINGIFAKNKYAEEDLEIHQNDSSIKRATNNKYLPAFILIDSFLPFLLNP